MAKPMVVEYPANAARAITAATAVVARLGYTLNHVDNQNGLITFETGHSFKSFAGQNMSIHVLETANQTAQITIGGTMKAHGAQMQIYDWGEAGSIASKVKTELDGILGNGTILAGGGSCFVATAVYGNYDHPSVLILRRYRDEQLAPRTLGRAFIRMYYSVGPSLAYLAQRRPLARRFARNCLDWFVHRLS